MELFQGERGVNRWRPSHYAPFENLIYEEMRFESLVAPALVADCILVVKLGKLDHVADILLLLDELTHVFEVKVFETDFYSVLVFESVFPFATLRVGVLSWVLL